MMDRFRTLQQRVPAIGDVRGLGAMVGVEFVEHGDPSCPATELVKRIKAGCLEQGLLTISAGPHSNVVRILCPLVITDEQLERGLDIIEEETLKAVGAAVTAGY